jgi:RHS repeat-associated protein
MVYDAWNRLAAVYTDDGTTAGEKDDDDTLVAEYRYDGRHRRIAKIEPDAAHSGKYVRTDYYYSLGWQVVEERRDDDLASKDTVASTLKYQYVWGIRYVDAPICRDEDKSDGSGGDPDGDCIDSDDEHLYYTQDANFNVTALVDGSDGDVVERYMYSPYGEVTVLHGDRDSSGADTSASEWSARTSNTFENAILYCGYYHDTETGLYHVRNRYYHPPLGRWLSRDPIGYADGMSLYEYVRSAPLRFADPSGLKPADCCGVEYDDEKQCCVDEKVKDLFLVCIRSGDDHSWIHAQNENTGEENTYGRWARGWGDGEGARKKGVRTDTEKGRSYKAERCCSVCDFEPTIDDSYGLYSNNCASYAAAEYKRVCGESIGAACGWGFGWDDPPTVTKNIRKANGDKDSNRTEDGQIEAGKGSSSSSSSSSSEPQSSYGSSSNSSAGPLLDLVSSRF